MHLSSFGDAVVSGDASLRGDRDCNSKFKKSAFLAKLEKSATLNKNRVKH